MNRTKDKINRYLAQSQSACRKSRSATDIIWAHRWIINANTEHNNLRQQYRYVKCIRHNSNNQLIDIAKEILNEDEIRILRVLLKETTLEIKVESAQTFTFQSTLAHLRETA